MAENDKLKIALEDMEKQIQGGGGPAPNTSGAQSATDVTSLPLNQGDSIMKVGK